LLFAGLARCDLCSIAGNSLLVRVLAKKIDDVLPIDMLVDAPVDVLGDVLP
jgi:hypothetical protein